MINYNRHIVTSGMIRLVGVDNAIILIMNAQDGEPFKLYSDDRFSDG